MQYIYRYRIAHHVPTEEETTFENIARDCKLDFNDVRRFLRVAIARHVFKEPKVGSVAHTAASKLLVNNQMLEAWILNIAEEFWPSLTRVRVSSYLGRPMAMLIIFSDGRRYR